MVGECPGLGEGELELVALVAGDALGLGVEGAAVVRGHGVGPTLVVVEVPLDDVANLGGGRGGAVLATVGGIEIDADRHRCRRKRGAVATTATAAAAAGRH